jgi:hypothetical protein
LFEHSLDLVVQDVIDERNLEVTHIFLATGRFRVLRTMASYRHVGRVSVLDQDFSELLHVFFARVGV